MASGRLAAALVLLALLVGGAGALALLGREEPGAAGEHPVTLVGPEGVLFEGVVRVEEATAFSVLEAAASQAGLALETERYPGMGLYVRAVGGHRAEGASGWIYEVRRGGSDWTSGDRSAERYALEPGDEVRWRWTGA